MEDLMALITDNKQMLIVGVVALLVMSYFPQAKTWVFDFLKKLRGGDNPSPLVPWGSDDTELSDFQALKYLRSRAKEIGDDDLLEAVKTINVRLFDTYE